VAGYMFAMPRRAAAGTASTRRRTLFADFQGRRDIKLADSSDFLAVCQRSDGPQTQQTMVSSDKS